MKNNLKISTNMKNNLEVSHNDMGGLTVSGAGTLLVQYPDSTYMHVNLGVQKQIVYNGEGFNGELINLPESLQKVFKFENGEEVQDSLTKFIGIVSGRADYLTGCRQYSVTPIGEANNKFPESVWIDEGRLFATGAPSVDAKSVQVEGDPGCDIAPPSKG
jgi:hypothetical protein